MKKYKFYVFTCFMAILSLDKSISCEFDCDTYCCFIFGKILSSLVYFNDNQDFFEQEAHATLLCPDTSLIDNINDNKHISGYFNQLSRDEILTISIYLSPKALRNLSITCADLSYIINNSLWKQYNVIHNYHVWGFRLSAMRISYACFYYETGKFDMAAKLGHREAIHQIRKIQREKNTIINSYDRYLDYKHPHYYGYF